MKRLLRFRLLTLMLLFVRLLHILRLVCGSQPTATIKNDASSKKPPSVLPKIRSKSLAEA